tara:strand:+ start:11768 stop:12031 length:264 start_codon:yes stop_codon:yes gene_type:complete
MKIIKTVLAILFLTGCGATPKKVFVHPEKFNLDLIVPTVWDGAYPVSYFEREMVLNTSYYDYMGTKYTLVSTDNPDVFVIRVRVDRP